MSGTESSGIEVAEEGPSEVVIHTPVSRRTRQQTHTTAPLRQGVGNDGPVYVKVPFSVTDLMAWKQAAGLYREDLERVGRVVDTLIRTQDPDWSDLQVVLDNLLDDTEKQMVLKAVWETDIPGKSKLAEPVKVELKEGAKPVKLKQYPIKPEIRQELKKLIDKFLKYKILEECESEYNTPILPVRKPSGEYRLVQDLRAVNQIVKDIYPVVANPYTLLTSLKETYQWFTVLDLKDAFFCIPLEKENRKLFAFEWENPQTGQKMQLTWTRLPQGFKNSPTIFGNQSARELEIWKQKKPRPGHLLLQYVDDILIATEEKSTCIQVTIDLLNFLGLNVYKVSRKKAQIACQTVIYLGFEISKGQ
ncbi:PREDICTED: endogenous retrovirus group K member 25 Pol protein-like [Tauraco erythrolophus]|uniref:endogenous retrovirus group K member 25 Pol protein-like n=1 Tax=Tauraco erythrolophus TaxID=121530 RepID=UPI0005232052|nr:PREDICTED: endogenous retrovirus group K member 25 Pol protein-like [Tauraco erythrolophus]